MIHTDPSQNLQQVLDAAPPGSTLQLAPGDYRIKTTVLTPGLTICGAGAERTRILWDDYAKKLDERGVEFNTFRTWTMAVCADHVTMRDLSIVNDALRPEEKGQEVALSVYGDGFIMDRCRLSSTQDTLFLGPLPPDLIERYDGFLPGRLRIAKPCRQRFTGCLIKGTVDFIFGCGDAVFEDCEIRSLQDARGVGYAAAPAHSLQQTHGSASSTAVSPRRTGSPPVPSTWPGPGGTMACAPSKAATTAPISPPWALTSGTTPSGTAPPGSTKIPR